MSRAGCSRLKIGVESGNEDVRRDMKKPFPTEYIIHTVEQCYKHNIQARVLLFAGYPTETKEKFQDTLELIHKLIPYKDAVMLAVGHMATIMEPSALSMELYDIKKDDRFKSESMERFWIYNDNDIYERLRRHKEMVKLATDLDFNIDDPLEMFTYETLEQIRHS